MDRTTLAAARPAPASRSFDPFSTGTGLTVMGAGLLSLAVIEAVGLFVRPGASTLASTPEAAFGRPSPAFVALEPLDPQNAVGTGPGAPRQGTDRSRAPAPGGSLVGIAATPIPNGTAVYRLWSSGAVEAMITTEENTWSDWAPAAPGLSTAMRRPRGADDNPDTNP
jgi:hypothetical protein